ncbi:iron-sulfur assembly protein IscA-like 2, mitochondrial [Rhodamnia argentea]|uniref:Iron-sulfur assembly protein IscA-like 2, mitochondrial n=1 Tax=Rhodamnia argentea TaxID=178133 RepID=A0ABM3HCI1_9MYRT|nr:iron-sulfur assembly protein IscA-like 2, mitochondrial [Rhodamnia argentea]
MESAACRSGGGLLRGLYRVIARRNLVYASSNVNGANVGERIHQAKQDMSRSSLMPLMKCISPFFAGRIQGNHRLLSSSSSAALHEASSSPSPSADDVHLTAACIQRMKELQAAEGSRKMLRLSVETGGCSGFQYVFNFEEKANSDDRVFEKDGVKLVIDNISFDFVKGATVDYVEELIRAAFQVTANPSAVGGCSCKSSFMVKQ